MISRLLLLLGLSLAVVSCSSVRNHEPSSTPSSTVAPFRALLEPQTTADLPPRDALAMFDGHPPTNAWRWVASTGSFQIYAALVGHGEICTLVIHGTLTSGSCGTPAPSRPAMVHFWLETGSVFFAVVSDDVKAMTVTGHRCVASSNIVLLRDPPRNAFTVMFETRDGTTFTSDQSAMSGKVRNSSVVAPSCG